MRHHLALCSLLPLLLTGCALTSTAPATPASGAALRGIVHGGQQPVSGAHVYLLAANTTGYNIGAATYPSLSLLNATSTGHSDATGAYVLTDSGGNFNITSDYTCTPDSNGVPGQQVYLYISGGNTGGGTNASLGLMAILADCPSTGNFASSVPFVAVNEVSTIAAAYAMAGFAYDATHVSSSGTNLAKVGIANAFANASNLATLATGTALATTPAGNGTVPQATINTLANILAACVNSTGAVTGPTNPSNCYTLFYNAESNGSSGNVPSDTATAAINIAHNPGTNIATLYNLSSSTPPFGSALTSQPNDFSLGINFTGAFKLTTNFATGLAIDASGNAWVDNYSGNSVAKLSNLGVLLSGSNGFTSGNFNGPQGIAIDLLGDVWVANSAGNSVTKISSSGTVLSDSGNGAFTAGGLVTPIAIAFDSSGNAWIADNGGNAVTELSSSGSALSDSGHGAYTGGGLNYPVAISIDGSGNAWVADYFGNGVTVISSSGSLKFIGNGNEGSGTNGSNSVGIAIDKSGNAWMMNQCSVGALDGCYPPNLTEFSNSGTILSGSSGFRGGGESGKDSPAFIAIDGSGNAWISNQFTVTNTTGNSVSEFSPSGTPITGANGYTGGSMSQPGYIAIDGSGDAWITNQASNSVTELIGIATPVITPICAGLPSTPTTDGSSNLGTRP